LIIINLKFQAYYCIFVPDSPYKGNGKIIFTRWAVFSPGLKI
jgi:hypothetical protein